MMVYINRTRYLYLLPILAIAGCLFSVATTVLETRYLLFGKHGSATVTKESQVRNEWAVVYSFADVDGKAREERDGGMGELDARSEVGATVEIQYIPGTTDSRLAWHTHYLWTIPFLTSVAAMSYAIWMFVKGYREHERLEKARR